MRLIDEFLEYKLGMKLLKRESLEVYKIDIMDFKDYIKKDFKKVEKKEIVNYIEILRKKYRQNSIKRKINSLRNFYKFLLKKRVIDSSPLEDIVLEKIQDKALETIEEWELNAILKCCDESFESMRDRVVIELISATKISINEILKIKISDLKLLNYKAFFNEEKTKKVDIDDEIALLLKKYILLREEKDDTNYLFNGLSRQNFRARFMRLGKKANLNRVVTPNMIVNMVKEQVKEAQNIDKKEFYIELKRKYMEIGIGDD